MLKVVLYQPEIPQNAGNIARTCAASGSQLHLVRPLGFHWGSAQLKRAGMDYWADVDYVLHDSWLAFLASLEPTARIWAFSTKVKRVYSEVRYQDGDCLLFGPESRGLPAEILQSLEGVTIPMPGQGRSLNLAVSVGIGLYEALRQLGFGQLDEGRA